MYDVVALGELLIDFTPSGTNDFEVPLFSANPGSAPANVLAMNIKLGGKTAFIEKVGKDSFGSSLKERLEVAGVNTDGLVFDPTVKTTLAFVHLDSQGDRSFNFYRSPGADLMLKTEDVNQELIANASIFHFGSVSLTGQPCRDAIYLALDIASSHGKIISYDPNYRPELWNCVEDAKAEMLRPISRYRKRKWRF